MVWDLAHGLERGGHAGDRRGALRRPGHRHGPLHVREHRPAGARDGGRADRRRRRRRTRSTGTSTRASRRASCELLARGLSNVERFDDGLLTRHAAHARRLPRQRRRRVLLRGRRRPPALGRGHRGGGPGARPARAAAARARSRCARPTTASTSRAIARAGGGGGHRRAAGFSTELDFPELVDVPAAGSSCAAAAAARSHVRRASCSFDKPAGVTSHDVVAQVRRRLRQGRQGRPRGTLDPFATGLLLVLVGRATRVQRFLMALPKRYETVARLGFTSTTGDPEGEIAPGQTPGRARPAHGRSSSRPRRPTARSRSAASAPTRSPAPARRSRSPSAR